jgi:ABC-type glycerol-3-phosphate transport system permease component
MSVTKKTTALEVVAVAVVTVTSVLCILPFVYIVIISLTDPSVYVPMKLVLIPKKMSFTIYRYILSSPDFLNALKSTVIITFGGVIINIPITFAMAYGLTKRSLPHRKLIMAVVIFALLFDAGVIPNYLLVRSLGLMNTYWAVILPAATNSWSVIVARSFLDSIPTELEDSGRIDGCSDIAIFIRIIIPLSMAAIATLGLFFAVSHWNVYVKPLMYLTDSSKRTLQVYVATLLVDTQGVGNASSVGQDEFQLPSETIQMATVVLAMLPIMVIYPFLQRYFMKGVMLGSVKG